MLKGKNNNIQVQSQLAFLFRIRCEAYIFNIAAMEAILDPIGTSLANLIN